MNELFSQIHLNNENTALVSESGQYISYSELFQLRKNVSQQFESRTLTLFLTNNSVGSVIIYLSLLHAKSVPILIDSSLSDEFIKGIISSYNPDYIIFPKNRHLGLDEYNRYDLISEFLLLKKADFQIQKINSDLALLLTTSGSTGSPKLVRISYHNIYSNTKSICDYLKIDNNDRAITVLPMNYSFGLSVIHTHLFVGASIFVTNKSIIESIFWSQIIDYDITFLYGVPFTFEILERIKFRSKTIPSLRYLVQAGGKLNSNLTEIFAKDSCEKKRKFFIMYGQTEATARMSYLPFENSLSKIGSIGIPIPGGAFSIVDDNGIKIDDIDSAGELVYEGPNVSLGYASCRSDLNLGDQNKGKLFTGDLATKDKDGYYYIVGRKKRFIKIFGNRTNLDEIENILKSDSIDCACVGHDDSLVIFITNKNIDLSSFKKMISTKFKINHSIINIKVINEIPKTTSGKTNYQELQ